MTQYVFSAGALYGRPAGNSPTPVQFGSLQGVTIEFAFEQRPSYGRKQFPIHIGRGRGRVSGKADFAQINAAVFGNLFFNTTATTGSTVVVTGEAHTITANAPGFTANMAVFVADLGVVRADNGGIFERVLSAPGAQQYTCNESTGAYAFDANSLTSDVAVEVAYTYTDAGNGKTVAIVNQDQGNAPSFMLVLTSTFNGKQLTMVLDSCQASKLAMPLRMQDFTIQNMDFQGLGTGSISLEDGIELASIDVPYVFSFSGANFPVTHNETIAPPAATATWADLKAYIVEGGWDDRGSVGGNYATITPAYTPGEITVYPGPAALIQTGAGNITVTTINEQAPNCGATGVIRWTGRPPT